MRLLLAVAVGLVVVGCKDAGGAAPAPVATTGMVVPAPKPPPPPVPDLSPAEMVTRLPEFSQAMAFAQPRMTDTMDKDSTGALLLAVWSAGHMKWRDVSVAKDETSFALAQKDPDEARGKRLCATGSIVQIEVEKTDYGKLYLGLLHTYGGSLFRFLSVGSTGDLVENSQARICGVVTGKYDYANSGGGTGHAIQIVGMFDLPQNHPAAK